MNRRRVTDTARNDIGGIFGEITTVGGEGRDDTLIHNAAVKPDAVIQSDYPRNPTGVIGPRRKCLFGEVEPVWADLELEPNAGVIEVPLILEINDIRVGEMGVLDSHTRFDGEINPI